MDVRVFVGRNIARLREEKGLTQAAVAAALEIDRAYVSGLERGERNPTVVTLWHIAKILDVPLPQLFEVRPEGEAPTSATKLREKKRG